MIEPLACIVFQPSIFGNSKIWPGDISFNGAGFSRLPDQLWLNVPFISLWFLKRMKKPIPLPGPVIGALIEGKTKP